jgi:molybdopterin-synthase adenylyltransferase
VRSHQLCDYDGLGLSVALTATLNRELISHVDKGPDQEDICFGYWRPSQGSKRFTAVLNQLNLPREGERLLQGNVAFGSDYLARVLDECPAGSGMALIHSHLGPGWQDMSHDDIVAERDRLAGVVASRTRLPVLGMTWGTDGTWSARFWLRVDRRQYERREAATVRVVGKQLRMSYHPRLSPAPHIAGSQEATVSVWGEAAQHDLARLRVGIVGLGSVGSIVAEALARTGIQHLTLIDADKIELRNLDRTLGAGPEDVGSYKVQVADRQARRARTAGVFDVNTVPEQLQAPAGFAATLNCDVIICCVDRPWPRHVLNVISNGHLIPMIDGGILVVVDDKKGLVHADWRIHTVGPESACVYCLDAVRRSDAALDRDGKLDDPDYIAGLSAEDRARFSRRNVFAFSLSVASHEVLHLVGLVTGKARVGGVGPQHYHAYPGRMDVEPTKACNSDCDILESTATTWNPIE